jgi:hypothetical protein
MMIRGSESEKVLPLGFLGSLVVQQKIRATSTPQYWVGDELPEDGVAPSSSFMDFGETKEEEGADMWAPLKFTNTPQ